MTTINFPGAPTLNQVYALGTKPWRWNGPGWNVIDTARGRGTGSPKTIQLNGGGAKTATGFALSGLSDGNHLYMESRKNI